MAKSNRIRQREYRKRNPEKCRASVRKWATNNIERVRKYKRRWQLNNPGKCMEANWRRQGIDLTYARFKLELKKQKHKCKICSKRMRLPQVDHDHKTGSFRGLLCLPCNLGLGVYERKCRLFKKYLETT